MNNEFKPIATLDGILLNVDETIHCFLIGEKNLIDWPSFPVISTSDESEEYKSFVKIKPEEFTFCKYHFVDPVKSYWDIRGKIKLEDMTYEDFRHGYDIAIDVDDKKYTFELNNKIVDAKHVLSTKSLDFVVDTYLEIARVK